MQAFYGTRISEHISESPEGFLICHSAPLCRTAVRVPQQYRGEELGLSTADLVDVYRSPQEVMSKKFLASLEGKPVTDQHPGQFLTADNVGWYARGHVQNVQPGPVLPDGERSVTGDLLITDPALIAKIKAGVRELSVGYTYDLQDDERGKFVQTNLAANHVAVVPEARGGEHLRIMDAIPREDFADMCARFHRTDPKVVAAERERRQRRAADGADSGEPRSWDELGAEIKQRLNTHEESMAKRKTTGDSEDLMGTLIGLLQKLTAHYDKAEPELVEDETTQGDWATDSALVPLRKIRPFVEASGDRQAIDSYNNAVLAIKRQRSRLVTDVARASLPRLAYAASDARAERARSFEEMAGRYHRRNFHIRSDREGETERAAQRSTADARMENPHEDFANMANRIGEEMRRKKY